MQCDSYHSFNNKALLFFVFTSDQVSVDNLSLDDHSLKCRLHTVARVLTYNEKHKTAWQTCALASVCGELLTLVISEQEK